jgi:hypothetical protein
MDLNNDGIINDADRGVWIVDLRHTYLGDANLDGQFDSSDMIQVLQAGTYELDGAAGWATGDWNGDGNFTSRDIVDAFQTGAFENGPLPATAAPAQVPEPSSLLLATMGMALLLDRRYRRRRNATPG